MRGVACVIPGTLDIEGRKRASELISEVTRDQDGLGVSSIFHGRGYTTICLFLTKAS